MEEPHEVALRRSRRQKRSTISNDHVVYLPDSEFDFGIYKDPVLFSLAIEGVNSINLLEAIKKS